MKKIIICLCFLFITTVAYCGDFVCHDKGTITSKYISCGKACSSRQDCIKVDRATLLSITKYHKVENDQVVEMTQQEKDALDAAEAQAAKDALKAQIESGDITVNQLLEALEELNITTKKAITDQVKTNEGLSQ